MNKKASLWIWMTIISVIVIICMVAYLSFWNSPSKNKKNTNGELTNYASSILNLDCNKYSDNEAPKKGCIQIKTLTQSILENGENYCETFSGDKKGCYLQAAMILGRLDLCDKAGVGIMPGELNWDCIIRVRINKGEVSVCEEAPEKEGWKSICYESLAISTRNITYCEKTSVPKSCIQQMSRF